jgi:membrane associated rhomboid family serine protease
MLKLVIKNQGDPMFPIQDIAPRRKVPIATYILMGINIGVFLLEVSLPPEILKMVVFHFGVVPARYTTDSFVAKELLPGFKYIDLVTCMFLHGGWVHLFGNMWTLWIFGDNVEDNMGSLRFVIFYLTCGITASLFHVYMHPDSLIPIIGASGAISGVLGAYYVLFPFSRVIVLVPVFFLPFFFEMPAVLYLAWWFFLQLFSGTLSVVHQQIAGGIAWWAHVGGFIAGVVLHRFFCWGKRTSVYKDEQSPWGVLALFHEKTNR